MSTQYICLSCDRYQPSANRPIGGECAYCGGSFVVRERDPHEPAPGMIWRPDEDIRDHQGFLRRWTF